MNFMLVEMNLITTGYSHEVYVMYEMLEYAK